MVVREIAADRERARALLDKQRSWQPPRRPPPRRVHPSQVEIGNSPLIRLQTGGHEKTVARQIASLVTGHNQLVRDSEEMLDKRTEQLLEEIDSGDKGLRDVLRELLRGSILERMAGVVAIGAGILLSAASSILSSLG
jgi:hypothetical protein